MKHSPMQCLENLVYAIDSGNTSEVVAPLKAARACIKHLDELDNDPNTLLALKIRDIGARLIGNTVEEFTAPGKKSRTAIMRMAAMALTRMETNLTFEAIGRLYNRGHDTVCYAVKNASPSLVDELRGFVFRESDYEL